MSDKMVYFKLRNPVNQDIYKEIAFWDLDELFLQIEGIFTRGIENLNYEIEF